MLGLFFGAGKRTSCFASLNAKFFSAAEHRRLLCKNEKLARSNTFVLSEFLRANHTDQKDKESKSSPYLFGAGDGT